MKKVLIVFCTVFLIGLITIDALAEMDSPWKMMPEVNLYSLINKKYEVIGTNFSTEDMGRSLFEVIYLQKGKNLYRCITIEEPETDKSLHICFLC